MVDSPLIAIVDDDKPLLSALGNLLRSAGYRVLLFENAEMCLAAEARDVDLVLTDYQMPVASGVDLMGALRHRGDSAPAIIMTAQPFDEVASLAMAAGACAVLSKPFDEEDLLNAMEIALRVRSERHLSGPLA